MNDPAPAEIVRIVEYAVDRALQGARELYTEHLGLAIQNFDTRVGLIEERLGKRIDDVSAQLLQLDKRPKIVGTSERQPRVLVVDDHIPLAHALAKQLELAGMSASPSTTVDDALKFLDADPSLEVAVVDVKMPKNGYTMLEYIREHHPALQVVMTSGRDEPERALELGAFYFLGKPFNMPLAVLTITRAAEHRRALLAAKAY